MESHSYDHNQRLGKSDCYNLIRAHLYAKAVVVNIKVQDAQNNEYFKYLSYIIIRSKCFLIEIFAPLFNLINFPFTN